MVDELAAAAGPLRGPKLASRIADATYAYERERYQEARRILRALVEDAPDSPAVRELNGLVLYRTGQWAAAAKELERYRDLSGSYDQHPVLADSYRALRRYEEAEELWQDLRAASPSCDRLGVHLGEVVAVGDNHNDLSVLAWAGTAMAPANAIPEVLALAHRVLPHNGEDGVAELLEELARLRVG